MSNEQELTGSQVAGAVIGAAVGNVKGTSLGGTLAMAAFPFLGPFALLLVPAVAVVGTAYGAKIASKGLGRAGLMAAGCVAGPLITDHIGLGDHTPSSEKTA